MSSPMDSWELVEDSILEVVVDSILEVGVAVDSMAVDILAAAVEHTLVAVDNIWAEVMEPCDCIYY